MIVVSCADHRDNSHRTNIKAKCFADISRMRSLFFRIGSFSDPIHHEERVNPWPKKHNTPSCHDDAQGSWRHCCYGNILPSDEEGFIFIYKMQVFRVLRFLKKEKYSLQ